MEPTIETNATPGPGVPRRLWASPPYLLLADDDRAEAVALAGLLRQQRILCDTVHGAEDAWRAFRARDYDMLLMNLRAPLQAGLDAAQAIRRLERSIPEPRVPVVIMTDGATEAHRRTARDANVDDVLERSKDVADLVAVVESVFAVERRTPKDAIPREPVQFARLLKMAGGSRERAAQMAGEFSRLLGEVIAATHAAAAGGVNQLGAPVELVRLVADKSGSARLQRIATLLRRVSVSELPSSRLEELLHELDDAARDLSAWIELGLGRDEARIEEARPAPVKRKPVKIFSILRKQVGVFSGSGADDVPEAEGGVAG